MPKNKVNEYRCPSPRCGKLTVTRDIHEGVTPFMMGCPWCHSALARSAMYRVPQFRDADVLWIRPTSGELAESDHVKKGGLVPVAASQSLRPISPQLQPNPASCLLTSFAMVLGVPAAELIEQIGHDGMEVIFPDLPPQSTDRYRGHHIQELIYALDQREYAIVQIEPIPVSQSGEATYQHGQNPFLEPAMLKYSGVTTGRNVRNNEHAVAWSAINKRSYDPATARMMPDITIAIRTFYAVIPKSNQPVVLEK